jgi:DNA polymerase III subunit delta'
MDTFSGVIGHDRVIAILERMLKHESLPHAFLFLGSEGVGRTTIAEKLFLKLFPETGSLQTASDYLSLEIEENIKTGKLKTLISVEQIRAFTTRISRSAMHGGWKVGFIEQADRLSAGATNALLKTLEEPQGKTLMILRAPDIESVLPTIASRCQILRFAPVSFNDVVQGLVKMGYSREDVEPFAKQSLGRPGVALKLLKDSAFRAIQETGTASITQAFSSEIPVRLKLATELVPKSETDKQALLTSLLDRSEEVLREALYNKIYSSRSGLSLNQTVNALERLVDVRASVQHNINPHLALEHLFLSV